MADFADFTLSADFLEARELPFFPYRSREAYMLRIALKYGAIASGLVAVWCLGIVGLMWGGQGESVISSEWLGYLVMFVSLSTIFIAVREYRNVNRGGIIKFLPAFGMGLLIALVASLAYTLAWEVYLASTNYAFMDNYAASMIEAKRATGVTGPELDAYVAQLNQMREFYANPLFRLPITFSEIFPVGLIVALISAAILRNPKVLPARG